jgi:hypothetical protein
MSLRIEFGPRVIRRDIAETSMTAILIATIIVVGGATLYFAARSQEFCKFLAGAFFVSAGIQFYMYLAKVSVPILGTSFVQTPPLSRVRALIHFTLFLTTFYFGFIRKRRGPPRHG